jgi:hypothetical protein
LCDKKRICHTILLDLLVICDLRKQRVIREFTGSVMLALPLGLDLVFVITFRENIPRTSKLSRKTRLAILYNLR